MHQIQNINPPEDVIFNYTFMFLLCFNLKKVGNNSFSLPLVADEFIAILLFFTK